jgi:energy-coupling factor transporter ATP-binding protein EcfA2
MNDSLELFSEKVSYAYRSRQGRVEAIQGLSCRLAAEEVTAILGPSGSGKSTLGLLLAGLLKPDSGTISFSTGEKPSPESIAYLFQFPEHLFSEETVEKELRQGNTIAREEAEKALMLVGLEPSRILPRSPFELSGGQARLVAMSLQLSRPSRVIIFDEPTAGLDWKMRAHTRRLIRKQAESGKIVGLITHHLEFATSVSDTAFVLKRGSVQWEGDTRDLQENSELRRTLAI